MFRSSVDAQPILEVAKFSSFKGCLDGSAAQVIRGLVVTGMNYSVATLLLKETFGKPDIISKLYDRLLQLPTAEKNYSSLKSVYMDMESLLQQLENQSEVFDNQ